MASCDLLAGISRLSLNQFSIAYFSEPGTPHAGDLGSGASFRLEASACFIFTPTDAGGAKAGGSAANVAITLHYPQVAFTTATGTDFCGLLIEGEFIVNSGGALAFKFTSGSTSLSGPLAALATELLVPAIVADANTMVAGYQFKYDAIEGIDLQPPALYATNDQLFVLYNMTATSGAPTLPNPSEIPTNELAMMMSDAFQNTLIVNEVGPLGFSASTAGSLSSSKVCSSKNSVTVSAIASIYRKSGKATVSATTDTSGSTLTVKNLSVSLELGLGYTWTTSKEVWAKLKDGKSFSCVKGHPPHKGTCSTPPVYGWKRENDDHSNQTTLPTMVLEVAVSASAKLYVKADGSYGINNIKMAGITNPSINLPDFPDWAQPVKATAQGLFNDTINHAITNVVNAFLGNGQSFAISSIGNHSIGAGLTIKPNDFSGGYVQGFYALQGALGVGSNQLNTTADGAFVHFAERSGITDLTSFTVETWVCGPPQDGFVRFVTKPTGGTQHFSLYTHDSTAGFRFDTSGAAQNVDGGHYVLDGKWHHIAGSYDGDAQELRLYVDGVCVLTKNTTGRPVQGNEGLYLGMFSPEFEQQFKGQQRETRIWNFCVDGDGLHMLMNSTLSGNQAGLEAYFTYNPANGSTVMDVTGHGNNGTCHGGAKLETNAD